MLAVGVEYPIMQNCLYRPINIPLLYRRFQSFENRYQNLENFYLTNRKDFLKLVKKENPVSEGRKKTESKPIVSEKTSNEQISEIKSRPTMKIYNSELADDLNAMLKQSSNNESSRLQIENRKNRESNISKYIREKKYRSFDFGKVDDEPIEDDDNEPLTFSREDYKKFMALSNIKDKKPL